MTELQIPVGVDPHGREVHINEARRGPRYYRCPMCLEYLEARRGDIREYFAHLRNVPEARNCPLRTQADVEEYVRRTPIEKREFTKHLWMGIITSPYSDDLRLVAKFRTPSWDDLGDVQTLKRMIQSIRIVGEGILRKPDPQLFHPNLGEVDIDLNPTAPRYGIEITSTPSLRCISGNWKGDALKSGDLFVGDRNTAEKVESLSSLEQGDILYLVSDRMPENTPEASKTYHLGRFTVVGTEIDAESSSWLQTLFPNWEPWRGAFYVDVVVPALANPRGYPLVAGPPGGEALIAVIPPPDMDPDFEIVSVPVESHGISHIPKAGRGIPRLQQIHFPLRGSVWVSIHWNARHKPLHFLTSTGEEARSPGELLPQPIPPIGLKISSLRREEEVIPPWRTDTTIEIPEEPELHEIVNIVSPEGLPIGLKGRIVEGDVARIVNAECADSAKALETLQTWSEEGCAEIELSLGAMGRFLLRLPVRRKESGLGNVVVPDIPDEEIRRRLLALTGGLPRKATWKVAREIIQVPSGTRHDEVPSQLKKRIRRVMMELREMHVD